MRQVQDFHLSSISVFLLNYCFQAFEYLMNALHVKWYDLPRIRFVADKQVIFKG